jgi:hypothetical protein
MITTCSCRHCGNHIEFDQEDFTPGTKVECPHCQKQTLLSVPKSKASRQSFDEAVRAAPSPGENRSSKNPLVLTLLVVFIAIVFIFVGKAVMQLPAMQIEDGPVGLIMMLIGAVVLFAVVALCVFWLVFPVFMYYGMQRQEELLRQIASSVRKN